jgi:predicted DCC family thiol-disulfide oxidoreductase YuxK
VLYDGACGFCSWWVPFWSPTLQRAGFGIAPLQSPWLSTIVQLDQPPLAWDLTLLQCDGTTVVGADVYRRVMRRVWWAYPFYVMSITPGLRRIFDWTYRTFARNRYCVSRACGLHAPPDARG